MKRWFIVFALTVFWLGAFCSCGKSDAVEDPVEETVEKSKISIKYEGEFNEENYVIVIYEYYDAQEGPNSPIEILSIITPNGDDPSAHFPAGRYCICNNSCCITKEIDGVTDYTFRVNYQDGSITEVRETRPSIKYEKVDYYPVAGRQGI